MLECLMVGRHEGLNKKIASSHSQMAFNLRYIQLCVNTYIQSTHIASVPNMYLSNSLSLTWYEGRTGVASGEEN